jgi:hypothetical protein
MVVSGFRNIYSDPNSPAQTATPSSDNSYWQEIDRLIEVHVAPVHVDASNEACIANCRFRRRFKSPRVATGIVQKNYIGFDMRSENTESLAIW